MGRVAGWVVALTFLVSTLWMPTGAEAAGVVVRMTAPVGTLTAYRSERRVELSMDGQPDLVFENASITVSRTRVTISARTPEHTLVAWANRTTETGGVGLLDRTVNPRKPATFGMLPESVEVEGETVTRTVRNY
jgi:hypothetical protein